MRRSGDVENLVIDQWPADMPGPTRRTEWRTSFDGERHPQSEVLEDRYRGVLARIRRSARRSSRLLAAAIHRRRPTPTRLSIRAERQH